MIKVDKIIRYAAAAFTVAALVTVAACSTKKETASNKAAGNADQSTESATIADIKDMQGQIKATVDTQEDGNNSITVSDNIANVSEMKPENNSNEFDNNINGNSDNNSTDVESDNTSAESDNTMPAYDNKPENEAHTHTWNPVKTTVNHGATGHYETVVTGTKTVVDKEAWDEPVYEYRAYAIKCLGCGRLFDTGDAWDEHATYQEDVLDDWSHGSYTVLFRNEQVDTKHHTAQTHVENITEQKWIEDTVAYDEEVITGYTCSCGATK